MAAQINLEGMDAALVQEFRDSIADRLAYLGDVLGQLEREPDLGVEGLEAVRRVAVNLKGLGSAFGFPVIAVMAHRLEDYLSDAEEMTGMHRLDVQIYADRLAEAVDSALDAGPDDIQKLCRALPGKRDFNVGSVEVHEEEVLLVMPTGTATRFVSAELRGCGYKVVTAGSALEALQITVATRPDWVLTTMVLPDLSGVDLACALAAMPSTSTIPVALLTSADETAEVRARLPANVPIVRKGQFFSDDVAAVFSRQSFMRSI